MTLGLVHASWSDSLLEWQAVKLTFFAPCMIYRVYSYGYSVDKQFWV